jgi:hypothetical protein
MLRQAAADLFRPWATTYQSVVAVVDWISRNVNDVPGSRYEQIAAIDVMNQRHEPTS